MARWVLWRSPRRHGVGLGDTTIEAPHPISQSILTTTKIPCGPLGLARLQAVVIASSETRCMRDMPLLARDWAGDPVTQMGIDGSINPLDVSVRGASHTRMIGTLVGPRFFPPDAALC